jgi:hypothetical protein
LVIVLFGGGFARSSSAPEIRPIGGIDAALQAIDEVGVFVIGSHVIVVERVRFVDVTVAVIEICGNNAAVATGAENRDAICEKSPERRVLASRVGVDAARFGIGMIMIGAALFRMAATSVEGDALIDVSISTLGIGVSENGDTVGGNSDWAARRRSILDCSFDIGVGAHIGDSCVQSRFQRKHQIVTLIGGCVARLL